MNHLFRNKTEAAEHAAAMVAEFWLKSAEMIIARGETPRKLSLCKLRLTADELDRDVYLGCRPCVVTVARLVLPVAERSLLGGRYPTVKVFFEVKV